ncbi:hypothetical protein VTL71DRAFT_9572 [Oculimacula yallundae]|uniref:Helicase C-terminal domain-containing protein n=1 Tax=Oculimacula yallundae TaxID=86028 RepID=A0ABR4BR68_9HELO
MSVNVDSAFVFSQPPSDSFSNFSKVGIDKYIAAGCLRISRPETNISIDTWQEFSQWQIIAGTQDPEAYNASQQLFIWHAFNDSHLQTSILQLHKAQWIRMELRSNDPVHGQVRVYVLPDDVGHAVISRDVPGLRKAMLILLNKLDTCTSTWNGQWSSDTPVRHVDPSLDTDFATGDDPSLFTIFNTLPSPKPDPELVSDVHARDAMYRVLAGSIKDLKTEMYAYQRRSTALMIQRESQPSQLLDPRLRHLIDQRGNDYYCDADSGSCFREPRTYEAARGGICAETMGLGKTLICLGLIMSTRDMTSQIPVEYMAGTHPVREKTGSLSTMAAATLGRLAFPWKQDLAAWETREGYRFDRCREALEKHAGFYMLPTPAPRRRSRNPIVIAPRKILLTSATIVVAPANLIQQWQHEIKKHTIGLNVLVMKAMSDALPSAETLAEYDIVLFSKQRFEKEAANEVDVKQNTKTSRSASQQAQVLEGRPEQAPIIYSSPLKDLHFKRLIVDEGHTFGNASGSSRTEASAVVDFLQVSARWIVSGTPTKGLYGAEIGIGNSQTTSREDTPSSSSTANSEERVSLKRLPALLDLPASETSSRALSKDMSLFHKQERKDIEKLGNIATSYLKARPWANRPEDNDFASWSHLIMQPRHGSKSRGNLAILKATLEGMIIRHRQDDIEVEVTLPPLHQNHVLLEGSLSNNLSLNTFSMMIVANAVTSERKDADYFFHPRQRKNLQQLVSNLRQASFFWSGFEKDHIANTIENARNFLQEKKVPISTEDQALLLEAVEHGNLVLKNRISRVISTFHEMPMHVDSDLTDDIRTAWSLTREPGNPTLMGATMVQAAQKFVESQLYKQDPTEGLLEAGQKVMHDARVSLREVQTPRPKKRKLSAAGDISGVKKAPAAAPALAGGVTIGSGSSPRKRPRTGVAAPSRGGRSNDSDLLAADSFNDEKDNSDDGHDEEEDASIQKQLDAQLKPKFALKQPSQPDISGTLDQMSPLATATMISTASSKLSYLMDRITLHSPTEKILIFYEADNIAYYIAQALESLGIKHLIYAKTLSSARRSQYVVTFNQSEVFRVLLMDVSQAAFGLDMSSASRVYFVNPVFSPQVEAQAVKRAHRIGQTKPVYVETLVLKGSIEEVILERRKELSTEEHNSCKSILDDSTMYDWIRNARFLDVGSNGRGNDGAGDEVEQMAMLETPKLLFGRGGSGAGEGRTIDPDQDLILGDSPEVKGKGKGKAKIMLKFKVKPANGENGLGAQGEAVSEKAKGKRKVGFADVGDDDVQGAGEGRRDPAASSSDSGVPVKEKTSKKVRVDEGRDGLKGIRESDDKGSGSGEPSSKKVAKTTRFAD